MNRLCLLCFSKFTKLRKAGRPKEEDDFQRRKEKKFKLLVNYLLGSPAKSFDKLKEEIVENSDGYNEETHRESFSLCLKCEVLADKLLELQLELEKVQMEMINQLKIVLEVVTNNREVLGLEGQDCLRNKGGTDLLDILKTFQDAAYQNSKNAVTIPLIFLERFECVQQSLTYSSKTADNVKTEPTDWADDFFTSSEAHPVESEDFHQFHEDDQEFVLPKQKTEVGFEGPSRPKRARSSAALARSRIIIQNELNETQIEEESAPVPIKRPNGSVKTLKCPPKKKNRKSNWLPKYNKGGSRDKTYYCDSCPFYSKKKICRFEEHLREHETEDKPFKCELCSLKFSTKGHLNFHMDRHKRKYQLKCDVCLERVPGLALWEHLISHEVNDPIPCQHCSQYSSSLENYMEHLKEHKVNRGVTCHVCLQHHKDRRELATHLHTVHQLLKPTPCDFEGCDKTFLLPDAMLLHKISHTSKFECNECSKRFRKADAMEKHKLRIHVGLKLYKCDQCAMEYSSPVCFRDHQVRDHGADAVKFKCHKCEKEFATYVRLRHHLIRDHDKAGKNCPICNAKFVNGSNLKFHMDANHTTGNNYICEECGKVLRTKGSYDRHRRGHGEKTFKCPYCPKAFALKKYLDVHERIHTGEKPYVCEFCGKAFNQIGVRGIHQRKCKLQKSSD